VKTFLFSARSFFYLFVIVAAAAAAVVVVVHHSFRDDRDQEAIWIRLSLIQKSIKKMLGNVKDIT